jgi:hypothetical protein
MLYGWESIMDNASSICGLLYFTIPMLSIEQDEGPDRVSQAMYCDFITTPLFDKGSLSRVLLVMLHRKHLHHI